MSNTVKQTTTKKISKIWKHFDETRSPLIWKCKACDDICPFSPHSHINVLYWYIKDNQLEDEYQHILNEILIKKKNESNIPRIKIEDMSKAHTKYLVRHIEKKHPELFEIFLAEKHRRKHIQKPIRTIGEEISLMVSCVRFVIMNNVTLNQMCNEEGRLMSQNALNRTKLVELINLCYEFFVFVTLEETSASFPVSVMIDEWKEKNSPKKILGVTINYLNSSLKVRHKCIGIIELENGKSVTIRRKTQDAVSAYFDDKNDYFVVHDTASVMNCAFSVDVVKKKKENDDHKENDETGNGNAMEVDIECENNDNVNEILKNMKEVAESVEQMKQIDHIKLPFQTATNVDIVHERCHAHIVDLVIKKTLEALAELKTETTRLNETYKFIQSSQLIDLWNEYLLSQGETPKKFTHYCETRFYVLAEMFTEFVDYSDFITGFLEALGYSIVSNGMNVGGGSENVFFLPNIPLQFTDVLIQFKASILRLSEENKPTIPFVIEELFKCANLIHEKLQLLGIEVTTMDVIPLAEIDMNRKITFQRTETDGHRKKSYTCQMLIKNKQIKLYRNTRLIDHFDLDSMSLLVCLYYLSSKYENVLSNKRLLIGNFLNPQTKDTIPYHYFEQELKREVEMMDVKSKYSVETELYNYKSIKMEPGIGYEEFWDAARKMYPRLFILSIKYGCMAASEVSVERLFSICGQIQNERRSRLLFDTFSKLAILQYNLKKSEMSEVDIFFNRFKQFLLDRMCSKL